MLSDVPMHWIIWAIVFMITLQCLISMASSLRDRLQGLLVAHVKKQQTESMKRQRIVELREKIRAKKAAADNDEVKEKRAA